MAGPRGANEPVWLKNHLAPVRSAKMMVVERQTPQERVTSLEGGGYYHDETGSTDVGRVTHGCQGRAGCGANLHSGRGGQPSGDASFHGVLLDAPYAHEAGADPQHRASRARLAVHSADRTSRSLGASWLARWRHEDGGDRSGGELPARARRPIRTRLSRPRPRRRPCTHRGHRRWLDDPENGTGRPRASGAPTTAPVHTRARRFRSGIRGPEHARRGDRSSLLLRPNAIHPHRRANLRGDGTSRGWRRVGDGRR